MKRVFDFMKSRVVMLVISALVIVGGIAGTVAQGGFNLGIDFQAGLNLTVGINQSSAVSVEDVRDAVSQYSGAQIQRLGDAASRQFVVRVRDDGSIADFEQVVTADILDSLEGAFPSARIAELETSYVGPRFSQDLASQAVFLTIFALVLILGYLWFRFQLGYAISSIAALVHDVLVILGVIGTLQLEVSTATIAAVLTIIGYSLNDTIVIFDRVRENEELLRDNSFRSIINTSISQSLSRTIITSLTTLLAVTAIFVFSTGQIQLFALTLMVGVVIGTYSSIFIASPVLLGWNSVRVRRHKRKDIERYHKGAVARSADQETSAATGAPATAAAEVASADVEAVRREAARKRNAKRRKKSK